MGTWIGKSIELGMSVFPQKPGLFLSENMDDIKMAGKKADYGTHVEEMNETRRS